MKTSKLSGPLLNYWLARGAHPDARIEFDGDSVMVDGRDFNPVEDADEALSLIEQYNITLMPSPDHPGYVGITEGGNRRFGKDIITAGLRAVVYMMHGKEVPDETWRGT